MTEPGPAPDQVTRWLHEVESEIAAIEAQIEPLLRTQARLQERRVLLGQLLASLSDSPSHEWVGEGNCGVPQLRPVGSRPSGRESVRDRVHREVVDVFRQVGSPLHINDLFDEYVKRGYKAPGQGKPANISVHLSGWDDVVSPERGLYGLSEMFESDHSSSSGAARGKG